MTSEENSSKTNEFLRRRKLRLQQVREQSKDIARKIRQRAKVENLKQVIELDTRKKKEYLQKQEKLVKKLQEYYNEGLENFGLSHKNASEVKVLDAQGDGVDLSKQRGKEAAAELRKKRQQVLDKQKEILDRKLHAREVANIISRDKSAAISKLLSRPSDEAENKASEEVNKDASKKDQDVEKNDMATQWDQEEIPLEWHPIIPALSLPKDDNSVKEPNNNNIDSKSDKSKRLDLFALSDEMPSSLRGTVINQEERLPIKSSLTLVSEYLQNRDLRLREPETSKANKKAEEFQSLKQTILRTRTYKEGNICQVHDGEKVAVPTWHAEHPCAFCSYDIPLHQNYDKPLDSNLKSTARPRSNCLTLPENKNLLKSRQIGTEKPIRSDLLPSPILRSSSPFRRAKNSAASFSGKGETIDKQLKTSKLDRQLPKRSLVTMYNHTTRDSRDVPYNDERLVVRNSQNTDDAYSLAMKESTSQAVVKDSNKKVQENRSKVAMTKQNVEKEYRDTIAFLNALPKDRGSKTPKTAYMDEHRQQMQKDMRQQKLEQEYKKIEKECTKHKFTKKPRPKSRSPTKESNDIFDSTDFQYSWMPVPESNNLAIHTIPTSLRESKNSVKFSKVDSYHEYRSRHKHTPPTKENAPEKSRPDTQHKLNIQNSSVSESDSSSSSVKSVRQVKKDKAVDAKELHDISDAERIIIYKILDSKSDEKEASKLIKSIAKSLTLIESKSRNDGMNQKEARKLGSNNRGLENIVSIEQLNEGVYKTVTENGDNIASMYFPEQEVGSSDTKGVQSERKVHIHRSKKKKQPETPKASPRNWNSGDEQRYEPRNTCEAECKNCCCKPIIGKQMEEKQFPVNHPSAATSTTSVKTVANDKATAPDGGFIKLIDDTGHETGKFYIGASGLLKNDAYEVVIQLRKKGDEKEVNTEDPKPPPKEDKKESTEPINLDKVTVVSSTQTSLADFCEGKENRKSVATSPDIAEPKEGINKGGSLRDSVANTAPEDDTKKVSKQTITTDDLIRLDILDVSEPSEANVNVKSAFDKLNTQEVPISNTAPTPRPATSTYTQTTLNSPTHRPILYHMSSSTSTAYMSPPEIIVPKFLKPGYQLTKEEIKRAKTYGRDGVKLIEHEYSMEDCDCRMCLHARRVTLSRHVHKSKHRCSKTKLTSTPPNTANTGKSSVIENIFFNHQCENVAELEALWNKDSKCSCSKCKKRKRSPGNVTTRKDDVFSNNAVLKKAPATSKNQKLNLKPDIKNYVDKLLVLNKENLKAVQIVDQDCSAVTTPGSSVIDVPDNINKNKSDCENKLSLQKIQVMLKNKIAETEKDTVDSSFGNRNPHMCYRVHSSKNMKNPKLRKKTAHKVKSLNISKKMSKTKSCHDNTGHQNAGDTSSSVGACKRMSPLPTRSKTRSQSSPTPRLPPNSDTTDRSANSDVTGTKITISKFKSKFSERKPSRTNINEQKPRAPAKSESSNHCMTSISNESDRNLSSFKRDNGESNPISTQTSINVDSEVNFIKLAEDKLQNMEKIADLTEKCTKRLSNLAKVLEEVRKNKTYSHVITSDASDTDQKSDKDVNITPPPPEQSRIDDGKRLEARPSEMTVKDTTNEGDKILDSTEFVPFLSNIPKPVAFKNVNCDLVINLSSSSSRKSSPEHENLELNKHRNKPPPALSRLQMKHGHDLVVPHELSTVLEVDSPMSLKLKTSRNDNRADVLEPSTSRNEGIKNDELHGPLVELKLGDSNNPDLLDCNDLSIAPHKVPAETPENSKMQMIDIEQFNEIMLKPFFSIQEYAKQCNIRSFDDGFNLEDIIKDDQVNDELSSLHSEASLPDVISELLKRNIISEPFKFDSGSNANSTTVSSDSTISVLALSRAQHRRNKASIKFENKENIGETSDTMSFSSNPDLENAFKNLGMGWASSTLKKTKERLALSSSSNTSSSSLSQFRLKGFNQDAPELVTDTVSSVLSLTKPQRNATDNSKNAEQQTSKTNTMTVKEFLTKELAKKITFNKTKSETQDEFMTLYETRMPEAMKHSSQMIHEEKQSKDNSMASGNNRARTSTPVQLYKSMTYHSSSSSNVSNGLFSNIEDLSSVKATSNSMKHSTSDKDDLIIPNCSLRMKKPSSDKSD